MYSLRTDGIWPTILKAIVNAPRDVFVATLLLASVVSAQQFRADLDGAQTVPLSSSSATGLGCFTLDASNNSLHYEVNYSGLDFDEVEAHIHVAPPGSNGTGVYTFPPGPIKIGTVQLLTQSQMADLNAGLWYVNIHTTGYLSGEIRGQILPTTIGCTVAVEEQTWGVVKQLYK